METHSPKHTICLSILVIYETVEKNNWYYELPSSHISPIGSKCLCYKVTVLSTSVAVSVSPLPSPHIDLNFVVLAFKQWWGNLFSLRGHIPCGNFPDGLSKRYNQAVAVVPCTIGYFLIPQSVAHIHTNPSSREQDLGPGVDFGNMAPWAKTTQHPHIFLIFTITD